MANDDLLFSEQFLVQLGKQLGKFHGAWASIDLCLSYGIGKFLKITHEEAHVLTAGMEFGRKATLLRNLVYRSDHPNRAAIIGAVAKLQNEAKRNVFAHSFMVSTPDTVTFVDRSRGGDYSVTTHAYTLPEWTVHVESVAEMGEALYQALGAIDEDFRDFGEAAARADPKYMRELSDTAKS
jgi:hypothetical protein